jgi:carbonic anhydrase/acetyltransferase-like protein (isoleucine patch superfamily)
MRIMAIYGFQDKKPTIDPSVFIEQSATIIGDVQIGRESSVWPHAVIRGDKGMIKIGQNVNIQDHVIIDSEADDRVIIGNYVSIGHGAILHGCEIGDYVIVGMGAIIMDNVQINDWVFAGAGTVITQNTIIPTNSLVLGIPGQIVDELDASKKQYIQENAQNYTELAKRYLSESLFCE